MEYPVARHQTENYLISTDVYEGPLDLLLKLIERAELDITRLSLAQVTNQYLEHLNRMTDRNASEVSAFLVIAAKLIQIKSEALLPKMPERQPGEEDVGETLALQLINYRKFKRAGEWFSRREREGLRTFLRLAPPPKVEGKVDLSGITLEDLVRTAYWFSREHDDALFINSVISIPKLTIQERIKSIITTLEESRRSSFARLLGKQYSRIDVVVTFLAILELIKRQVIDAHQEILFTDILLETTGSLTDSDDFELEFIE